MLWYAGDPTRGDSLAGSYALSSAGALGAVAAKIANGTGLHVQGHGTRPANDVRQGPVRRGVVRQEGRVPDRDGARAAYSVLFIEKLDEA